MIPYLKYDFLLKNAKKSFDFVSVIRENFSLLLSLTDDVKLIKQKIVNTDNTPATNSATALQTVTLAIELIKLNKDIMYEEAVEEVTFMLKYAEQIKDLDKQQLFEKIIEGEHYESETNS